MAYPLLWEMLDKKGDSNSTERMDLLDCEASRRHRFQEIFPDAEVA